MAPRKAPVTVSSAAASGDRRATLEALRARLAAAIDVVDERYLAPLAQRLTDVVFELDRLSPSEASAVDDLAAARQARRAAGGSEAAG